MFVELALRSVPAGSVVWSFDALLCLSAFFDGYDIEWERKFSSFGPQPLVLVVKAMGAIVGPATGGGSGAGHIHFPCSSLSHNLRKEATDCAALCPVHQSEQSSLD